MVVLLKSSSWLEYLRVASSLELLCECTLPLNAIAKDGVRRRIPRGVYVMSMLFLVAGRTTLPVQRLGSGRSRNDAEKAWRTSC